MPLRAKSGRHRILRVAGVAALMAAAPGRANEPAWMLHTLAAFQGTNGCHCHNSLMRGPDDALYGLTVAGGPGYPTPTGFGTAFRVTTKGQLTTLHVFNGTNGSLPESALMLAADGNFYGTTGFGGEGFNGAPHSGRGTLFRLSPGGELTTLIAFNGTNGAHPSMNLVQADDGWLYGGTATGWSGAPPNMMTNRGALFRCSTNGELQTLHEFSGLDGDGPAGRLLAEGGFFWGTTLRGGSHGAGTVFQLAGNGIVTTVAHFDQGNGARPVAGLSHGSDGRIYGATQAGGQGYGMVYRLDGAGVTLLKAFTQLEAENVNGALALGRDGALYGTAANGGNPQHGQPGMLGSIFRVTTNGVVTVPLSFNFFNGRGPVGGLLPDGAGGFLGTTAAGVANDEPSAPMCGTVFHYRPATPPVLNALRVETGKDSATLRFELPALAGVTYGLEMNNDLATDGWEPVPETLWPWGWGRVWNASHTNGLLTLSVAGPTLHERALGFFRAVLLPP